jgi:CDGSH iron-sulfur domain-containing protein 3
MKPSQMGSCCVASIRNAPCRRGSPMRIRPNTILKHVRSRSIGERIITCLRRADGQQRRERARTNACKFKHGAEIASRGRAFRCDKERLPFAPMRGCGGVSLAGTRAEGEQKVAEPIPAQKAPYGVNIEAGKDYWWCACGRSAKQPFCDGSHKAVGLAPLNSAPPRPSKLGCADANRAPTSLFATALTGTSDVEHAERSLSQSWRRARDF